MEEALTQDKYSKRNSDESHREFQYHCRGANFMLLSHERPGVLVFKLKQAQKKSRPMGRPYIFIQFNFSRSSVDLHIQCRRFSCVHSVIAHKSKLCLA